MDFLFYYYYDFNYHILKYIDISVHISVNNTKLLKTNYFIFLRKADRISAQKLRFEVALEFTDSQLSPIDKKHLK